CARDATMLVVFDYW
nr:immunoglobulin heavy chain junction region [Macaca mulatta]MOV47540.1 immunoglobulin heavy chain junction region [Macaca mulatta]MOV47614.1 immunoglobulin heavy chain junction region [Macaca mulatta]MOV47678.1 immunoglobulin heavy chain junction region [Macaca mulatta]MOV47686.1 immunoglobulin heavy chain junction region [Macaca mulatta]